ncbi:MAG: DNA-binding response regulator, partial [Calditrichaeota bacterium]
MILLLSNNPDTAQRIKEDLQPEGFDLTIVDDFLAAIITLKKENRYRILLVDFEYDKHDVLEVMQKIKRDGELKHLPLICIVDRSRMVDQLMAFEMGADDFIYIPYSTVEIQLKIRSLQRLIDMQNELVQKDTQLQQLKNAQRVVVTLSHYINNALTPLYFAVQVMDETSLEDARRVKKTAWDTVEFI